MEIWLPMINGVSITSWEELSEEVKVSPNEAMNFTVERDGESNRIAMTPNEVVAGKEKVGQIGVQYVVQWKKIRLRQ